MKTFDDIPREIKEVEAPVYDKYALQKQRLLFNVTRSQQVCDALGAWLSSFQGGMSKQVFMSQLARLDFDDSIALEQLKKSQGRRTIHKNKTNLPKVPDIIQLLGKDKVFIAVTGNDSQIKGFVRSTYQTLKNYGNTVVLDLNELVVKWLDLFQSDEVRRICRQAQEAEFLIILGFEKPVDIPRHVDRWFDSLRRYRLQNRCPMIMPFARFRENSFLLEHFEKFSV